MTQEQLFELAQTQELVTVIDKFGRKSRDRAYVSCVWPTTVKVFFLDGSCSHTLVEVTHDRILRIDQKYVNLVE